jgi:hypothetical protein
LDGYEPVNTVASSSFARIDGTAACKHHAVQISRCLPDHLLDASGLTVRSRGFATSATSMIAAIIAAGSCLAVELAGRPVLDTIGRLPQAAVAAIGLALAAPA